MKAKIFLRGFESSNGKFVHCPLASSCVVFFLKYCQTQEFEVIFISTQVSEDDAAPCCELPLSALEDPSVSFLPWDDAPSVVRKVALPSVYQPDASLVRAGLCVVIRHVIKTAHTKAPAKHMIDLLGFRQGSMRMCAEVSGWTKLCEVELPQSIALLLQSLKQSKVEPKSDNCEAAQSLTLPLDLIKLEGHFQKKCRIHNDDKKRRAELVRLREMVLGSGQASQGVTRQSVDQVNGGGDANINVALEAMALSAVGETDQAHKARIEKSLVTTSGLEFEHVVVLPHCIRRVKVCKDLNDRPEEAGKDRLENNPGHPESRCAGVNGVATTPTLAEAMAMLTYLDVEFVHTYSEGPEITLADLILFVYLYLLLEQLEFEVTSLLTHLPSILEWLQHMASLPAMRAAGRTLGWDVARLTQLHGSSSEQTRRVVTFELPEQPVDQDEDEMELSRCVRMKHKAIKPEVYQAFKKLELAEIEAKTGTHPCGEAVTVDWDSLPAGVHPRQGDVPEKRTRRKCQQLENLATAVQALAQPGDIIVDFCSGGGHLGIVLAYLLPECEVYLVENKEESLLKVCSRLESVALKNVTLFQSNIDYFTGKFDIGVCLHACGSATDMVLQLCLDAHASFVICPCCYGSIHKTHLLTYPRSKQFQTSSVSYKDFLTLGHAADQTEFNIALEGQGRKCMNLVDSDRAEYAREVGYKVTLCSLQPLSCTPKNNLLVGARDDRREVLVAAS